MVEVQVADDQVRDVLDAQAGAREHPFGPAVGFADRVDVPEFRGHLRPGAAIHEHDGVFGLDQEPAHREVNPVPLIGRVRPLPQRLRNHPEHRSAIESEPTPQQCPDPPSHRHALRR